ncbi:MAG: GNAT family N-acetyltransferase [Rhizobiaceae bacterium]|nr:GNAT family N-acetyltransferase [Rhizobiaceae bacterium]
MAFDIRRADEGDIPFVMATERGEGFAAVVGRWDEARHRAALADGEHAYFIGRKDGRPRGFVIFRSWNSSERVCLLKRIAVDRPGEGDGRLLLRAAVGAAFGETDVHRLWLGVFPDNARARRAYEACGFQAEGTARGSAFFDGRHRDELVMSLLRHEWLATRSEHPDASGNSP